MTAELPRGRHLPAYALGFGLALLALALLVATHTSALLRVDRWIEVTVHHDLLHQTAAVQTLRVLAFVLAPGSLLGLIGITAVVLALRRMPRTALWIAVGVGVEQLGSHGLKALLSRPRPSWRHPFTHESGWSFPSGHASGAAFAFGVAIVLTWALVGRRRPRVGLTVLWSLLVALTGFDRIGLGVHYASDVVGGFCLGGFALVVTQPLLVARPRREAVPLPSVLPREARVAVVLNPTKLASATPFRALVERRAREAGWEPPLWFETTVDDAGHAMARAALAAGATLVLAAGGDGTVRVVCAELAGSGVPVGIVPLGTGNLLARNLGLPLGAGDAVGVALTGHDRAVDIVELDGDEMPPERFVVMAGLGLDAAIMAGAADALKARMGWPAYALALVRHLRFPAARVEISVDGRPPVRRRARTVVIGNVGSLTAGVPLLPDAVVDDGLLDVVVVAPRHTIGWLRLLVRVMRRARRTDDRLDRMTGREVLVRTGHALPRQLDGDIIPPGRELHARVSAGALLVRVPRR